MKRIIYAVLALFAFSSLCFGQSATIQYKYNNDLPFYRISEINQADLSPGLYNTEGYVIFISTCPPCPDGAVCETCLIDHLLISETDQPSNLTGSKIRKTDLVLFADNVTQFKAGEKYRFTIRIPRAYGFDATFMKSYNDRFQVVGYKLIDTASE
jgi:hypothetical protein